MYLCGKIFKSSLEGFRIKSIEALLGEFVEKGGGLVSMLHILFLANPCFSREPKSENCIHEASSLDQGEGNQLNLEGRKKVRHILEGSI